MKRIILFAILLLGALFVTQAVTTNPIASDVGYAITTSPMLDSYIPAVADLPASEACLLVQRSEDLIQLTTEVRTTKDVELQAGGLTRKYPCSSFVNLNDSTGFLLRLSNKSLCLG